MINFADAPITFFLIIANALISGYAFFGDPTLIDRWAFRPVAVLRDKQYYRLITGGFLHGSLGHLAFNMITLYFFGPWIEHLLGPLGYLVVYFGSELAAHALTLYFHKADPMYSAIGASGAISGVLFSFCLFQPFQKIFFIFIPIGIPAFLFAILYVVFSVYAMKSKGASGPGGGAKIAHEAHLGGAIGGLLLTILLEPRAISIFLSNF